MAIPAKVSKAFSQLLMKNAVQACLENSRGSSAPFASNPFTYPSTAHASILTVSLQKYALEVEREGRRILVIWILRIIIFSGFPNEKQKWPVSKPSSQLLIRLMY